MIELPNLVINDNAEITDVQLDLETLSTSFNAKVISLAAVGYNRFTGEVVKQFYARFDSRRMPGDVSRSTLRWWLRQDAENPGVMGEALNGKDDPIESLENFVNSIPPGVCVWGNGSIFDVVITENTLNAFDIKIPWEFYHVRDLRTLADMAGVNPRDCVFDGDKHNALHDALHQTKIALYCKKLLGVGA